MGSARSRWCCDGQAKDGGSAQRKPSWQLDPAWLRLQLPWSKARGRARGMEGMAGIGKGWRQSFGVTAQTLSAIHDRVSMAPLATSDIIQALCLRCSDCSLACWQSFGVTSRCLQGKDLRLIQGKRPLNPFVHQAQKDRVQSSLALGWFFRLMVGDEFVSSGRKDWGARRCRPLSARPVHPVPSSSPPQGSTARTVGCPPAPYPRLPHSAGSTTSAISED